MAIAPMPMTGETLDWHAPWLAPRTSRYLAVDETETKRVSPLLANFATHHMPRGPRFEDGTGRLTAHAALTVSISKSGYKNTVEHLLQSDPDQAPTVISQQIKQKILTASRGARPTYSGSHPQRWLLSAVTTHDERRTQLSLGEGFFRSQRPTRLMLLPLC